jgi:hypothetical protein
MDPDPDSDSDPDADLDPSIFITDLQDGNKKLIFLKVFLYITVLRYLYIIFKAKKAKIFHITVDQGYSYYICLMIEGSGSGAGSGSRSIPLTNGSGSGRPKNTWVRLIRIRIRIRNTV